jgi:predicted acetyltransferase
MARQANGLVARDAEWWARRVLASTDGRTVYRFCTRRDDAITSYVVYTQEPLDGYFFTLRARELIWTEEAAIRALLGFIGGNAPLGRDLTWPGPIDEPMAAYCDAEPERAATTRWMLRLVDLKAALEARGYPRTLRATLDLAISDALVPSHTGGIRLAVADGRGAATAIPRARLRVDIGTLAALYTGWLTARDADRMGRLPGATDEELSTLQLLFGGSKPWMAEYI